MNVANLTRVWPELLRIGPQAAEQLRIRALYANYTDRQAADIAAFRRDEKLRIPADLDYAAVGSLSSEAKEKLLASRPETIGAAARIPGVTPAAVVALLGFVRRGEAA